MKFKGYEMKCQGTIDTQVHLKETTKQQVHSNLKDLRAGRTA